MYKPYEEILERVCDFKVEYTFYDYNDGGRENTPFQGYRSDFWYEHSAHGKEYQNFMIWPEFENENGDLILDDKTPVSKSGTARMWIISDTKRAYHLDKIKVGTIGYFREGYKKVAVCKVIEIL